MILALDLGSKIGYYKEGAGVACTFNMGSGDERFHAFRVFLDTMEPSTIAYEKAAFQQGHAIPLYHGLVGVLKEYCVSKGINHVPIPVLTIKKVFTGRGSWPKEELKRLCKEKGIKYTNKIPIMNKCDELGIKYEDDNSADSYAVYHTYMQLEGVV